jgi:hypothetical protein
MHVEFRVFRGAWASWQQLFSEAAEFASRLGPRRLINISHSEDTNEGVVAVWFWDDSGDRYEPDPQRDEPAR